MIYEVHRKTKNNIGDYWCNPSRYFNFDNITSGEILHNKFPIENQAIIIGGGGLIHKKFSQHIQMLLNKNPKVSAIWGIGHNFSKKYEYKSNQPYYPAWLEQTSLYGIRDWIDGHHDSYLPCVSCMHPAFDKTYQTKHDVIFYTHAFKSKYQFTKGDIWMKNSEQDFDKVIDFLGSGKTIITDSYHGAYWGQLLGKDVRVISWSVKFNYMKHQPSFLTHISQWKNSNPSKIVPEFLEESRKLNKEFYQKFLNLL